MLSSSNNNVAAGGTPEPAGGKMRKVELTFEGDEGVALRYMTWADGLGWCCQKTIRVEGEQLDELHRAIAVARHRFRRSRAEGGEAAPPAQVIQLPSLS